MPDGALEASDTFAIGAMHNRLIEWGLCWLRAGKSDAGGTREVIIEVEPDDSAVLDKKGAVCATDSPDKYRIVTERYADPDPDKKPRQWAPWEIERAGRLHSRIIRLPLAQRLVLQVFYAETIAAGFHKLPPDVQNAIVRDLTNWRVRPYGVNRRIEVYNRDFVPAEKPIHWTDFMGIRDRGIRMLVNGERMIA